LHLLKRAQPSAQRTDEWVLAGPGAIFALALATDRPLTGI
jgi:hypothetical protein